LRRREDRCWKQKQQGGEKLVAEFRDHETNHRADLIRVHRDETLYGNTDCGNAAPKMMHEKCGATQNYVVDRLLMEELLPGVVAVAGLDEQALLMEGEIDLVVSSGSGVLGRGVAEAVLGA